MKVKHGKETITTKIAYLAGFFDGEGCVRLKNANHVIAHVTNSNLKILETFKELFGGQIRRQEKAPNKTIFNYYITCAEAIDMLSVLSPFLIEKLEQVKLAVVFHNLKSGMSKEEKVEMAQKMTELKKQDDYQNPELVA